MEVFIVFHKQHHDVELRELNCLDITDLTQKPS